MINAELTSSDYLQVISS